MLFFSSMVVACRTDGVITDRSKFASSHSSDDLGSLRDCLEYGSVDGEEETWFAVR
jgi:hypothetical protein